MINTNQPVAYPIFTFRWLAIHGLAVPQCSSLVLLHQCNLFNDRRLNINERTKSE